EVWGKPHIGTDASRGSVVAVDLVTPITAIFADEVITGNKFGRGRLRKAFARFKIHHIVMALEAVAFQESLGSHWEDPMVVLEPPMFPCPAFSLLRVIWRM